MPSLKQSTATAIAASRSAGCGTADAGEPRVDPESGSSVSDPARKGTVRRQSDLRSSLEQHRGRSRPNFYIYLLIVNFMELSPEAGEYVSLCGNFGSLSSVRVCVREKRMSGYNLHKTRYADEEHRGAVNALGALLRHYRDELKAVLARMRKREQDSNQPSQECAIEAGHDDYSVIMKGFRGRCSRKRKRARKCDECSGGKFECRQVFDIIDELEANAAWEGLNTGDLDKKGAEEVSQHTMLECT